MKLFLPFKPGTFSLIISCCAILAAIRLCVALNGPLRTIPLQGIWQALPETVVCEDLGEPPDHAAAARARTRLTDGNDRLAFMQRSRRQAVLIPSRHVTFTPHGTAVLETLHDKHLRVRLWEYERGDDRLYETRLDVRLNSPNVMACRFARTRTENAGTMAPL